MKTIYQDGHGNEVWEQSAMGCTKKELFEHNPLSVAIHGKKKGLIMLAMSILSDAQSVLELDCENAKERNRQYINRAKCCLIEADKLLPEGE